ncbi:helix-turn-helix domain-containing protein [Paenibacillus graminis]|uniref:helix-turn-helix domain-containing protein n=1 Tax=Paenibacillus graminis TaxID=189425 RepID=UPI000471470E|nr:helix-turn-helix transcriptional regulator [Paenibacillus graminis]
MSGIAERIEAVMKERKVSRYKLAKDTGIPYTTVTQILNGRTKSPQITALQKIADYFDMPLDQLTKETDESPKHNAPEWASTKDLADIKKILEEDQPVLFDGVPITDDTRQRAMDILTGLLWEAKELNKKTYGHKKKPVPKDEE